MSDELGQHRCPKCGLFTRGRAYSDQGSNEMWYWKCSNGHQGSEGY